MTSSVVYQGNLRTQCLHLASGNIIITDAPVDNQGKGEAFSPTDTVATALASCMLTIMGIKARDLSVALEGTKAEVTKTMGTQPRRIVGIKVRILFPHALDAKTQQLLERAGNTCPVHYSLNPDIEKDIEFIWP